MLEAFESFKTLLSNFVTNKHQDTTPRKRRLSRDVDEFRSKMRRFNDFTMPRCSSPVEDLETPSSSKSLFKKPFITPSKPFSRPADVIDLSDDEDIPDYLSKKNDSSQSSNEDWIDVQGKRNDYWGKSNFYNRFKVSNEQRHRNVLQKAKNTLAKNASISSRFNTKKANPITSLNESIRVGDYKRYKEMLDNYSKSKFGSIFNGTDKKTKNNKVDKPLTFVDLYKKRFNEVSPRFIDLTNDDNKTKTISIDSESDSDVRIIDQKVGPLVSPVNSLKKRLEIEPVTNEKWISEWDINYARKMDEQKQLIEECEMRRDKFRDVNKQNAQFRLEESLKKCLRIQDVIILDEEPEEKLTLPELTDEHNKIINNAIRPGPAQQVFIDKFNLRITRSDLQTLRGLNWLNDEVINFYTNLISERGNGSNPKMPRVHSMNTFFYPKLISQGYNTLRRWTKRIDIFAQDLVVVPVHLGVHWCVSIIDFRDKTIKYYDSMGGANSQCLKSLLEYLKLEHLDKKKSDYDVSDWKTSSVRDIPQQMNGSDCGMFACMYAEFLTRNAKILFNQEHMPYFRKKMVYEIVTGQLLMQ